MNDPVRNAECAVACVLRPVHTSFLSPPTTVRNFPPKSGPRVIFVLFKHFLWSGRPRSVWQPITIQSSFKNKRSPTVHHRSNRRVFRRNRFDGFRFERNLFVVLKTPAAATAAFNPKYVTIWEISLTADH